ncbi:Nuclear transcription factor Y subunit B-5 [Carex littledalei]|uniref:Nuclear transcription factor Y subunit B-5 n=1 Tax=Carex littledalei TaxID=544730 RepID=A0A833W2Y8_9POAL|nr:Nuclear transcription factor Y subunit B-5 [Carex littledalei]
MPYASFCSIQPLACDDCRDCSSTDAEVEEEWIQQQQRKPFLSSTRVVNVMESITKPADYMISNDAKKLMYDCAAKFVEVVFGEAKAIRRQRGDDIFTGDHLVEALGNIGLFDQYGYLSAFIQVYRYSEHDHYRAMINNANRQTNQPQLIGTALMELQGNNSGHPDTYLVDQVHGAMVNENAESDQQLPIGPLGTVLMEQQGNNHGHPNPYFMDHVHGAMINENAQIDQPLPIGPIGTVLMEEHGNNPGPSDPYLVDHFQRAMVNRNTPIDHHHTYLMDHVHRAMLNANAQIDQPQPVGEAFVEQHGNNPGHPNPHLFYPGVHMQLPQPVPPHFHIPPMQRMHVPLFDLGMPVLSRSFVHHSQVVFSINNPGPLLLPQQAPPAVPHMLLLNALGAGALPFEQPEEEEVPDLIMYEEEDDEDCTSDISEVE